MSTNEVPYIVKWMVALFRTDTVASGGLQPIQTLKPGILVVNNRIPTSRTFPLIMMNLQAGTDTPGNASVRLMTRPLFQVKVVHNGPISQLIVDLASRVDHLLQNTKNAVFEGHVISVRREQPIAYSEPGDDAEQFYEHVGGLYRVDCHRT